MGTTFQLLLLQGVMLAFYLGLTAGKPDSPERLYTVCSQFVSEHAFHFIEGTLTFALLFAEILLGVLWTLLILVELIAHVNSVLVKL